MKSHDQATGLFWLLFSAAVLIGSLRLGIGTLSDPGPGLIPFGASGCLGIFSLILFVSSSYKKETSTPASLFVGTIWKRVLLLLVGLGLYVFLMPRLGYLIGTFLLMVLLFWIVRIHRWWWVVTFSFLSSVITYYVFSVWLKGNFPVGILGL